MIKPLKNKLLYLIIKTYVHYLIKRDFEKVVFNTPTLSPQKSILLLGNHFSWWDGFIPFYLNNLHYRKKFYILMLEEKLRQFPLFRFTGAYSIQKRSRSAIMSLRYTAQLLENPNHLVVFFPQGKIQSIYQDNPTFEKGLQRILELIQPSRTQIVLSSTLPDYLQHRRPTLYVRWQVLPSSVFEFEELKRSFQEHLLNCKKLQSLYEA
ncbi:MAG: lysophospholipid acyltransferase family protein [Cytophagales bacterium]|nr:lysophospholipid acyltransferase family protein [Cytophagales bacterium]MDW8383150.1 lysophospholipid acyltransferase family protein [Flammeovirgaceae bacterium]